MDLGVVPLVELPGAELPVVMVPVRGGALHARVIVVRVPALAGVHAVDRFPLVLVIAWNQMVVTYIATMVTTRTIPLPKITNRNTSAIFGKRYIFNVYFLVCYFFVIFRKRQKRLSWYYCEKNVYRNYPMFSDAKKIISVKNRVVRNKGCSKNMFSDVKK